MEMLLGADHLPGVPPMHRSAGLYLAERWAGGRRHLSHQPSSSLRRSSKGRTLISMWQYYGPWVTRATARVFKMRVASVPTLLFLQPAFWIFQLELWQKLFRSPPLTTCQSICTPSCMCVCVCVRKAGKSTHLLPASSLYLIQQAQLLGIPMALLWPHHAGSLIFRSSAFSSLQLLGISKGFV